MVYDIDESRPAFVDETGAFDLTSYMNHTPTERVYYAPFQQPGQYQRQGYTVNCNDQAACLTTLGRTLGIPATHTTLDLQIFSEGSKPNLNSSLNIVGLCPDQTPSYFATHGFVTFQGNIYDACIGPYVGVAAATYLRQLIANPDLEMAEDNDLESLIRHGSSSHITTLML